MGGNSGFLQFHSTCYNQHSSSLLLLTHYSFSRTGHTTFRINKRSSVTMSSSLSQGSTDNDDSGLKSCLRSRRALVFVGVVSMIPLMPAKGEQRDDVGVSNEVKNIENMTQREALSASPILSFLNGVGIISSGVLGAFYALARQEQKELESKIESLTKTLNDKEVAFKSMQKNYESKIISEQEAHSKQLQKAKDEQLSLTTKLDSANNTITKLGQELQCEKKALQEIQAQVDNLQSLLSDVREDKKVLEAQLKEKVSLSEILQEKINSLLSQIKKEEEHSRSLASSLAEKEFELNELKAAYGRSTEELVKSSLQINKLEEDLRNAQKELTLKNSKIADLSAEISALVLERDESFEKINEIQKQYDDLKSDAEKKAEVHAELVKEMHQDIYKLREKLELALNEVSDTKALVAEMANEKDRLNEMLRMEVNRVRNLKQELDSTQAELETSRKDAAELEQILRKSRKLCDELESQVLGVQAELAENKQALHKSADEAKKSTALLTKELDSSKELLKKTINELNLVSNELSATRMSNDDLQKQLIDMQKIVETAASELNEERTLVAALNKELRNLKTQISKDKETQKSLETMLEETTASLDQINRNTQLLSKDLELAKSQIFTLEDEKDAIYKSLVEQKDIALSNRENLEDAHNLVMRLGTERENLDKKSKKLEDELATAKGEILRLRSEMNTSKTSSKGKPPPVNNHPENGEVEGNKVATSAKKTGRRKKSGDV